MSDKPLYKCRICGNIYHNSFHIAKEMLFGFRDSFEYVECGRCGCVQIKEFPENIQKYYPNSYWPTEQKKFYRSANASIKRWFNRKETEYYIGKASIVGALLTARSQPSSAPVFSGWDWAKHFRNLKINTNSSILDVGCGSGDLLAFLWNKGFSNLHGVDPNVSESVENNGWKMYKGEISDLSKKFDLIMMHHSFEHMQRPFHVLRSANLLLNSKKHLVIRIPIATAAWEKYGVNWVQLDPPRHFFLHTMKSVEILASRTGFEITEVEFDSTDFQFWASEQYIKGIPLKSPHSYLESQNASIFQEKDISTYKNLAEKLNKEKRGDQVCLYLQKI
jgi:SAM-dependent methyltransferase